MLRGSQWTPELGYPLEADENVNYADWGFLRIMPNYADLQNMELCRIVLGGEDGREGSSHLP